jgi:hypothetical protein
MMDPYQQHQRQLQTSVLVAHQEYRAQEYDKVHLKYVMHLVDD